MSMTPSSRRRLQAGALLAPILIVQGAAWFLGGGPAAAPAATPDLAPVQPLQLDAVLAPARTPPHNPLQQRCLDYLATGVLSQPLRSPMAHDLPPEPPPPEETFVTEPAPTGPEPLPVPSLTLTALLNNRSGGMAAIDGKIIRPGDAVAPGWRLVRIDHAKEQILIASDDGQSVNISLPRDLPR